MPKDTIPRRPLGESGVKVSAIGVGGYHLGLPKSQAEVNRIVHEALDSGIDFFDNAWDYHDGESETRLGKALKGRRDGAFLMTKACPHGRDRKTAKKQLDESLRRLQTDYLDLWQIHEVIYDNEVELYFRAGSALEALLEARQEGKVRFIGFTGHKDPAIHLAILEQGFPFDTCQIPLNPFDATFRSFEQFVLPELIDQGIAPIGMKSLGGTGLFVKKRALKVEEALRYAMSLPVMTTVSGIDSVKVLRQNLKIARGFRPMPKREMEALRRRCAEAAGDGHLELYKTSMKHDGDEGRRVHGFDTPEELAM
jgi:uncharacterized protein